MAPSPAFPWPRSSISSSFIFSLHSSFHLLCAAVSLPPAASPVPPACLSALGSFVPVPCPCSPRKAAPGVHCPRLLPQGFTYSARYCNRSLALRHPALAPLHRHRQSRERRQPTREGAPAGRVPAQRQHTHTHTHEPGRTHRAPGTSRATESEQRRSGSYGSSLHLRRETYGKAKESQHLFFITKHPSCH